MTTRMACSAARSAAVTGSKPPTFLFKTARAVRKNGRIVSPEAVASWSTKLLKSMGVMFLFGLSESQLAGNQASHELEGANHCRYPVAVRSSISHVFAFRQSMEPEIRHQPCQNSMGIAALKLDFCATRGNLLQCSSESYCCPPWAFPP